MKRAIALLLCLCLTFLAVPYVFAAGHTLADVNGDGSINVKDVLTLRKRIAGISVDIVEGAADINGDGDLTMDDVRLLRRHFAGLITIDALPITDAIFSSVYISGIDLNNYFIVIPANCDVYTVYAAELLQDYIEDKTYIELPIVTDETEENEYEFLIGLTNREESASAANDIIFASDEYLLKQDGGKIVMLGDSYMIGGGVGKFTYDYMTYDPAKTAQICHIDDLPDDNIPFSYEAKDSKNAILMIGDGMGQNHIDESLKYNIAKEVEENYFEFAAERLPVISEMTTYSLTTLESGGTTPTDSAASGTALSCGYKTLNTYVGLSSELRRYMNIRELSAVLGKRNAILSTEQQEGATPAAFTAHVSNRRDYDLIHSQQSELTNCDYLKGDIEEDLLAETKYALDLLSTNNEAGFFTMIEESYIDIYSHKNSRLEVIHAMARFNSAIRYAMVFTVAHPDTLLIITADHETGGVKRGCTFATTSHTTVNVPLFAIGNGSEKLSGVVDNTDIPKVIADGWGVAYFGDQTLGQ